AGGGITFASTQIGKVAGDTLLATGVNAAAGGIIGNMSGMGGTVLLVQDCGNGHLGKCLLGLIRQGTPYPYVNTGTGAEPETLIEINNGLSAQTWSCPPGRPCTPQPLINFTIPNDSKNTTWSGMADYLSTANNNQYLRRDNKRCLSDEIGRKNTITPWDGSCPDTKTLYVIENAYIPTASIPAAIIDWNEKTFGTTQDDFENKFRKSCMKDGKSLPECDARIFARDATGIIGTGPLTQPVKDADGHIIKDQVGPLYSVKDFYPINQEASDGGLVDLHNKARLKATAIGAGVGGALGGFSAYQGATDDVNQRWVAAVQAYKDSLQKFYCATGNRLLGPYNDTIIIPNMAQPAATSAPTQPAGGAPIIPTAAKTAPTSAPAGIPVSVPVNIR
ncbi:MAG: hypothetical protein FWC51_02900, partial [Proteobacteria bacterium]|nr:hypothetical protein [Pseudomonadota bacterium]